MTAESPQRPTPEFKTESVNDLAQLLHRAANWAEQDARAPTIAAEFDNAREFVENEVLD